MIDRKSPPSARHPLLADRPPFAPRTRLIVLGSVLTALALIGGVFAWPMIASTVSLTLGSVGRIDCAAGTEIVFEHGIDASGSTSISSIRVTGVNTNCANSFVALALYNNSGTLVDEIVWPVSVFSGDTSVTLVADGATVSSANNSNGPVSIIYPLSQTDPEGFVDNLSVESIARAEIITLPTTRAARE